MGDGYFAENTLKLCTDNFTKEEVLICRSFPSPSPHSPLSFERGEAGSDRYKSFIPPPAGVRKREGDEKFRIKATINKRSNPNDSVV